MVLLFDALAKVGEAHAELRELDINVTASLLQTCECAALLPQSGFPFVRAASVRQAVVTPNLREEQQFNCCPN